ncbi:MAG: hypothetical protein NZM10_01385 [Fimbriimonadales bacterium]|nr:hypothetical protein [Fimbriimonadales bacterium]
MSFRAAGEESQAGSKLSYNKYFPLEIVPIWGDGIPVIACDGTNAVAPTAPADSETI